MVERVPRPSWFCHAIAALEDAAERNANRPASGRFFWLAPRAWRLNAAFAGGNACAAVVLARHGPDARGAVGLLAALGWRSLRLGCGGTGSDAYGAAKGEGTPR